MLLILFHKRAVERADIINLRRKRADGIARARLKKASQLMHAGRGDAFYDEVLRALWDYAGSKLVMPVEQLSRDNIAETFARHDVRQETIEKFLLALDACEYERYAPGDASGNMGKTYTAAAVAISEIEDVMKKKRKL